jgi:hypothetical protein
MFPGFFPPFVVPQVSVQPGYQPHTITLSRRNEWKYVIKEQKVFEQILKVLSIHGLVLDIYNIDGRPKRIHSLYLDSDPTDYLALNGYDVPEWFCFSSAINNLAATFKIRFRWYDDDPKKVKIEMKLRSNDSRGKPWVTVSRDSLERFVKSG